MGEPKSRVFTWKKVYGIYKPPIVSAVLSIYIG
jgi:hypothetical protein